MTKEILILGTIPAELRRKEVFLLEGIRYAFGIIQISYQTLIEQLHETSKLNGDKKQINSLAFYKIFKEAWSIIDFSWKLRNLIIQLNHNREKKDEFNQHRTDILNLEFFKKIRDFRNTFQHLDERIVDIIEQENDSVWGNISWLYVLNENKLHSCLLYPGNPRTSSDIVNPAGLKITPPICHITLTSINRKKQKLKINISEYIDELNYFMKEYESVVRKQLDEMDNSRTLAQDMIFTAEISFKKN